MGRFKNNVKVEVQETKFLLINYPTNQ